MRRISKVSARNVFAILNNHFRGQAVSNALELQHTLTAATPAVPETLRAAFPALAAVTTAQEMSRQRALFSDPVSPRERGEVRGRPKPKS